MQAESLWTYIQIEASELISKEPLLSSQLQSLMMCDTLSEGLNYILSSQLEDQHFSKAALMVLINQVYQANPNIIEQAASDLTAVVQRDPAVTQFIHVLLYLKGFLALQTHRIAYVLWQQGRHEVARTLQSKSSQLFGVDIHPGCQIGQGVMLDHATGIVIGETAIVEDHVSIMQAVTLGGTGNELGDRHPKVRKGAMIGAGAKILGNIEIGQGAKVGAGSVVLKSVPAHTTAVGTLARVVGQPACENPSETMQQDVTIDQCHQHVGTSVVCLHV